MLSRFSPAFRRVAWPGPRPYKAHMFLLVCVFHNALLREYHLAGERRRKDHCLSLPASIRQRNILVGLEQRRKAARPLAAEEQKVNSSADTTIDLQGRAPHKLTATPSCPCAVFGPAFLTSHFAKTGMSDRKVRASSQNLAVATHYYAANSYEQCECKLSSHTHTSAVAYGI